MREAHQKALAAAAALEGEIERLSCPLSQRWLEAPMGEAETTEYIDPWNTKRGGTKYHLATLLPPIH